MRKFLPVCAAAIVVSFGAIAAASYNPLAMLDIAGIGLDDGKLVMRQPKLEGFDKDEKPYRVTADRALQDLANPDVIDLESLTAEMGTGSNGNVIVEAALGKYNSKIESLVLTNGVKVTSADGMDITMENADIDMSSGNLQTDDPVHVVSKDAEVTADKLRVYDEGKRIVFSQSVRMIIHRPQQRGQPAS